jgi:hypothetical protein
MPDGSSVNSVTLGAMTGLVLRSSSAAPPPPATVITLKVTKNSKQGLVKLTWSGTQASRVDVYRSAAILASVSNTGAYIDKVGKRVKATYTYKVCEAGTSTCSASVSASLP